MKITPVILCGGSGTRLWPLSRQHYPKQFLKLVGDTTLFQQSVSRAFALENEDIQIEEILIVTNENHRFLVLEQLDELKINLPTAEANQVDKKVEKINISISANGDYAINESPLRVSAIDNIVTNLRNAANSIKDPVIIISADSDSPHQSVINVMEAARIAGLTKITFSTKVK